MSSAASTTPLRKLIEERVLRLGAELETLCESEINAARRRLADDLNQAVRRLRQSEGIEEISITLADAGAGFCNVAAVFAVAKQVVRGVRVGGPGYEDARERFRALGFPVAGAEAFAGALETQDPVITAGTVAQLSEPVVAFFAHPADERVYLFPVGARAVLYAAGAVQMAPLELLAQAASAALELQERRAPASTSLVSLQPAAPKAVRSSWDELPAEEQQRHIRAQRFARVQAAEIRLYYGNTVRSGRQSSDLYGQLRAIIDAARAAYRESFIVNNPTMVDYLHLELLRTLAHGNEKVLGKDYPGPLV